MKKKKCLQLILILCLIGAGVTGFLFWKEIQPRTAAEKSYEAIRQVAFKSSLIEQSSENQIEGEQSSEETLFRTGPPDFDALAALNPDIVGWIYSPGTTIDYPIVRGIDNDYYLNHTVDGRRSIVGSVFMESKNSADFTDDITIVYGHHIKYGKMFSSLSGYKNQSYYNQHPSMILYTREKTYDVLLFAGNVVNGEIGAFPIRFSDHEERNNWLGQCLQNSTFSSKVSPNLNDRILVLCTCTYEYQNARYIVYGVLKEQEVNEVVRNEK